MKHKKLISMLILPFLLAGVAFASACGKDPGGSSSVGSSGLDTTYSDLLDAPSGSLGDETFTLGEFRLEFYDNESKTKGVRIVETSGDNTMFYNDNPCQVFIKNKAQSSNFNADEYFGGYHNIKKTNYGFVAEGKLLLDKGYDTESICWVVDAYSCSNEGAFDVRRTVYLKTCKLTEETGTYGIRSRYVLYAQSNSDNIGNGGDFDMFVPAQLYKDDTGNSPAGFLSGLGSLVKEAAVLETWTGLPMSMLRETETGFGMAIVHDDIDISAPETALTATSKISDEYNFGSVGFAINGGAGVEFNYPGIATPKSGSSMGNSTQCYWHELWKGLKDTYNVSLIPTYTPDMEDGYNQAMVTSYTTAMKTREPYIVESDEVNINDVLYDNVNFINAKHTAYGMGFNYNLINGNIKNAGNIEFGFIGMAPQLGNQLLDYGIKTNNAGIRANGEKIVNNWVTADSGTLPVADRNCSSGAAGSYPSFIRIIADGMDAILDAYLAEKKAGTDKSAWYNYCVKIANNIVNVQGSDGSFARCYETSGSVCTRTSGSPDQYKGSSKFNTPTIVRFLARMYELTNNANYRNAALKAAKWSYNNLYLGMQKYIGGACDNPDVVDKEAACFALYCFNAAYLLETDATWKEKYLNAAEHAACSVMSWTIATDWVCASASGQDGLNTMKEGGTIGFSFIATGNAACDNFAAFMYYELFRTYVITGNEAYATCALLLQQDTKLCSNYDNRMGWGWKSLCPEATTVSEFTFSTVDAESGGAWLPWNGAAATDPIVKIRHAFGSQDVFSLLDEDIETLRARLNTAKNMGGSYAFA